jgi:hypothetical protein
MLVRSAGLSSRIRALASPVSAGPCGFDDVPSSLGRGGLLLAGAGRVMSMAGRCACRRSCGPASAPRCRCP